MKLCSNCQLILFNMLKLCEFLGSIIFSFSRLRFVVYGRFARTSIVSAFAIYVIRCDTTKVPPPLVENANIQLVLLVSAAIGCESLLNWAADKRCLCVFFCSGGNGFFYEALLRLQVLLISCQNDLVVFFFFSRISFNYSQTLDAICIWVFIHRMRDRKWVKLIRLTTINRKRKRERRVGEKRDSEKRNKQS